MDKPHSDKCQAQPIPSHTIVHDPLTRKSSGTPWSSRIHSKLKEKLQIKGSSLRSVRDHLPGRQQGHRIVTLWCLEQQDCA